MKSKKSLKRRKTAITALLIVIALLCLVSLVAKTVDIVAAVTGKATHGQTTKMGTFSKANPEFGAVKGNVLYVIYDGDEVISSDAPSEEITVYFAPQGSDVNVSEATDCERINGALARVDADDGESACVAHTYSSPTAYECSVGDVAVYKTTIDLSDGNAGCFAAKIPGGDYDVYV